MDNKIFLFILIILLVMYLYLSSNSCKEGFNNRNDEFLLDESNFGIKLNNDIYDNFYTFLYDEINDDDETRKVIANTLIKYSSTIQNHLLDASSKCGHLTELLTNSFDVKCIDKYDKMNVVHKNKYPHHNLITGNIRDSSVILPNTFTHVCIGELEIYDHKDVDFIFMNVDDWLIHNGHMFILVFKNMKLAKQYYHEHKLLMNGTFIYSSNLTQTSDTNYKLKEHINSRYKQERTNIVDKYFHSNDHLVYKAETNGFHYSGKESINDKLDLLIFKKVH